MQSDIAVFWFRRDLRLDDNAGLYHALKSGLPVLPIFIFDTDILNKLEDRKDKRVSFIHDEVTRLNNDLGKHGSSILTFYGKPSEVWKQITDEYSVKAVFCNHDYEPYGTGRDLDLKKYFEANGIVFHSFKDIVIFEKDEVLKNDGTPYVVFTPYSKRWLEKLTPFHYKSYRTEKYFENFVKIPSQVPLTLLSMGFEYSKYEVVARVVKDDIVKHYKERRNFPALNATSGLSVHLRFGTLSIRKLLAYTQTRNETFRNELIWRDFYHHILYHYPHTVSSAFRKIYDNINWSNDEELFEKWCQGKTGYPLVDAGMRQLNETGFMHNRVRMVVSSFLTKHLLIDWRWGEAYFASKLMDYDAAANIGGWQWAAGCGTDAAPYFRIFNPASQQEKFDKDFKYIKQWVPEFGTQDYPLPIVNHEAARERCLQTYKVALNS